MDILLFSFNGVAPICVMVLLGIVLRRTNTVTQSTAKAMNKLCFQLFIPCKIFSQIYQSDLTNVTNLRTIVFALMSTATCLLWDSRMKSLTRLKMSWIAFAKQSVI